MKIRHTAVAALGAVALSLAPLAPAMAAEPLSFGLGALFAHAVLRVAALPLAIAGAIAAQSQDDRGYGAPQNYAPTAAYPPPAYYAAPPGYYAPPAPVYYSPRAAYYAPAPRYYTPSVSYYGRPGGYSYYGRPTGGYYGARPGYYAPSGYQAARRSGYYHYAR
jgi:hypothetical protein